MADRVPELCELVEAVRQLLLGAEQLRKAGPIGLAGDRVLELAEIGVLQDPGERRIVVVVHRRVLAGGSGEALANLLSHMLWKQIRIACKAIDDGGPNGQLDGLDLPIKLPQLGREVEPLLDQQILDRCLDRALPLVEEHGEILGPEWISEKDVKRDRGDEVGFERGSHSCFAVVGDQPWQVLVGQTVADDVAVGVAVCASKLLNDLLKVSVVW